MPFALPVLLLVSFCLPNISGNDVTNVAEPTHALVVPPNRPLTHRNQTKTARNDQLLSLLASRRREIIQKRFRNHIKNIVDLSSGNISSPVPTKVTTFPNATKTLNVHLNLSDLLLRNSVGNNSNLDEEQVNVNPSTESNVVNVSSPRNAQKRRNEAPQAPENKTKNMPIIRNILYRRKMSYLNRKLPLDLEQIAFDTLSLSDINKSPEDLILDNEDSLQVEESSHDKLIYYDVKNNASKKSGNNFEDASDEIKNMHNKTKTTTTTVLPNQQNTSSTTTVVPTEIQLNTTEIKHQQNKNTTRFMSSSLSNYFRPLDVPEEEMQPFLRFGEKLPNIKPSRNQSYKSIEKAKQEKLEETNATVKDEEEVDENMDVSISKPQIYENKIAKINLPNSKSSVGRDYFKNRIQHKKNVTEVTSAPKLDKKTYIHNYRNITRNRGFRNSTIFVQNKRNGVRHTINLKGNSSIANLKPATTTELIYTTVTPSSLTNNVTADIEIVQKDNITKLQNLHNSQKMQMNVNFTTTEKINQTEVVATVLPESSTQTTRVTMTTVPMKSSTTLKIPDVVRTTKQSMTLQPIKSTTLRTTLRTKPTTISTTFTTSTTSTIPTTSTTSTTSTTPTTSTTSTTPTFTTPTTSTTSTTPQERRTTEARTTAPTTTAPSTTIKPSVKPENNTVKTTQTTTKTSKSSTTTSSPTTGLFSTAVVTSVSIESAKSRAANKSEVETKIEHTNEQNKTEQVSTTTDINLDFDATVIAALNNFTSQGLQNTTQRRHPPRINYNISSTNLTNKRPFILRPTTTEPPTTTSAFIIHVPDVEPSAPETTRLPEVDPPSPTIRITSRFNSENSETTTQAPKRIFNTTVLTQPSPELELPLATLFSVTDFQKPDSNNSTKIQKPSGTETVISRKSESDVSIDNIHAAYILAALGFLPMMVIVIYVVRSVMKKKPKMIEDYEAEMHDNEKKSIIHPVARLPTLVLDPSNRWEFPRAKLRLQTLLGQGNFGQVWKAEADDLKGHVGLTRLVAVKTIKDGAGTKERDDLLKELAIMQKMGSHPNVVTLLGCCTDKEPYLLIMEYVMYGKLLTFLRDHRTRRDYYNFSDDAATLTARDLTVFSYCVARGMEYLSSKGIIHRDLAARNILVDHNKLCKIADFGMSRDSSGSPGGEVTEPRAPRNALPVRWMAVESLLYSVFTHKSDVWAFGVLLWEIVTLGSSPYANMSGREVMRLVCAGYRLERPGHCRPELYGVMARCWVADPESRPSFADLRDDLAVLLEQPHPDGSYVDLESFRADPTVYEIDNCTPRGNYFTVKSRFSEFECDI